MTDQEETNEAVPADDLRSALASAIASHEADAPETNDGAKPTSAAKPAAAAEAQSEPAEAEQAEGEKKARAEDGKFAKADKEKAAEVEKPAAKPEGEPEKKPGAPDPLARWSAADKQMFNGLPQQAKDFLLRRHTQMEGDYVKKTQAIAALKNEYEPIDAMFAPYRSIMQQRGFTPSSLIRAWANVEQKLVGGPDSAIEVVKGLVNGYRIPVDRLASALGFRPAATNGAAVPPTADGQPPAAQQTLPQLPPELVARLDGIEREIISRRNAEAAQFHSMRTAAEQGVVNQIEEFKSATDASGNLLHPHFDDVEADMTMLANIAGANKQQPFPSLDELYERAVWANPSTRAALQAQDEERRTAQAQAAEKKRAEEARAKAAAARRAGSSVTGAPGTGQAPSGRRPSDLSLREQLEEAVADHEAA